MAQKPYPFPVFGTQGGGLVREVGGQYVFVEPPATDPSLTVGSIMPEEWGVIPANSGAQAMFDDSIVGRANCGCVWHAEEGIPCEHDLALAHSKKS